MLHYLRRLASAVICPLALPILLSGTVSAASQAPKDLPVSLDRIREELSKTPKTRLRLDMPVAVPVATFRTEVQRKYVLSFEEWLEKEFTLTDLQRQSADWAGRCCGIGLAPLFNRLEDALQRRKARKIREQIARELAELEAARKKAELEGVR